MVQFPFRRWSRGRPLVLVPVWTIVFLKREGIILLFLGVKNDVTNLSNLFDQFSLVHSKLDRCCLLVFLWDITYCLTVYRIYLWDRLTCRQCLLWDITYLISKYRKFTCKIILHVVRMRSHHTVILNDFFSILLHLFQKEIPTQSVVFITLMCFCK